MTRTSITPKILDDIRLIVEAVLADELQSRNLLKVEGEDAQIWLDSLQIIVESPGILPALRLSAITMTIHLSKRSGLFPQCLMIKNVKIEDCLVGSGGFGDVWRGKIGEQIVCLKIPRVFQDCGSLERVILREYVREAIVWQQLRHPNLLPFIGLYHLDAARLKGLCLVSPWMERGNLVNYLTRTPTEEVDHYSLVYDVASGLAYMHSTQFVHGDLKGVNVLITPDQRACIGDLGLSRIAESGTRVSSKGTIGWMSPELLNSHSSRASTTRSDVYAFSCVCYEIFTCGKPPFHELPRGAAILAVVQGKLPSRPAETAVLNDEMWEVMVSCWNAKPDLRPTTAELVARIGGFTSLKTGDSIVPASGWDAFDFSEIWRNAEHPSIDTELLRRLQSNLMVESKEEPARDGIHKSGDMSALMNESSGMTALTSSYSYATDAGTSLDTF